MQCSRLIERTLREAQGILRANLPPAKNLPDNQAVQSLRAIVHTPQVREVLERGNDTALCFVLRAVNRILSEDNQPDRRTINRLCRGSAATARRAAVIRISSGVSRAPTVGHPQNLVGIASRRAGRGVTWHAHDPQRWRSRLSCFTRRTGLTGRTGLTRRSWLTSRARLSWRPRLPLRSLWSGLAFRTRLTLTASRQPYRHDHDDRDGKTAHISPLQRMLFAAARRRMVSPPAIGRHADPRFLKSLFFLSARSR